MSTAVKEANPVLQVSGSEKRRQAGEAIERYPLDYAPSSTTQVNTDRLPPPEELVGMELAFREEPESEVELCRAIRPRILRFAVLGPLTVLVVQLISAILPFKTAMFLSVVAAVLAAVATLIFPRQRSLRLTAAALLFPVPVVASVICLTRFLSVRPFASLIFGMLSLTCMFCLNGKSHPIYFYREYIFTAPHLRPQTRKNKHDIINGSATSAYVRIARILWRTLPSLIMATIVLFLIVVAPAYSPTVAILLLFVLALLLNDFWPPKTFRLALKVLAHHLTYGHSLSGAPGVWIPEATVRQRRRAIAITVFMFYVALSTGLCLYFPSEFILLARQVEQETSKRESQNKPAEQQRRQKSPAKVQALPSPAPVSNEEKRDANTIKHALKNYFDIGVPLKASQVNGKTHLYRAAFLMLLFRQRDTYEGARTLLFKMWWAETLNLRTLVFFAVSSTLAIALPNLLILGMFRHILLRCEGLRETVEGIDHDGRTEWQWHVDRIRESQHESCDPFGKVVRESDHLFLGIEPTRQFPVLIDQHILDDGHAHIVGQTGSGKTSLGIMPLLIQLIRGQATPDGHQSPPVTTVIFDQKGDQALFYTAWAEAKRRGQTFRFFSPERGKASHFFNPFQSFGSEYRTMIQLCHLMLDSLELNHGTGYGRSYFSRQSRLLLFDALNHSSRPRTFPDLFNVILKLSKRYKDSFELLSTIHALQCYPQLVTSPEQDVSAEDVIHFPTLIERSEVCYFWLPAAVESISVREIGKLALFCLFAAAIDRQRAGKEPRQIYLFIDEFQRIAGENFGIILEQARSFGISAILANQTISDLKNRDFDLRPSVRANTRLKLYFSVNDPQEARMLSDSSGEEIAILKSWATGESQMKWHMRQSMRSVTWKEELKSRLTRNDIARISDHPLEMIAHVSPGSGYTQFGGFPFPVRTTWPIPEEVYRARARRPLPDAPKSSPTQPLMSPKERDREARKAFRALMNEDIQRLIQEIEEKGF